MPKQKAEWIPVFEEEDGEVQTVSCYCSNCEEEEGPDAPQKFDRCPNCNCRMINFVRMRSKRK